MLVTDLRLIGSMLALTCIAGCVTQPEWVASPAQTACPVIASKECLSEILVRKATSPAVPEPSRDGVIRDARVTLASIGVSEPQSLVELRESRERWLCSRPDEALLAAGDAVEMARSGRLSAAVDAASSLEDAQAKRFALQKTAVLAAKANDQETLGRVLVLLSQDDQRAYMEGLQARLLNLLSIGDLERAASLQTELLEGMTKDQAGGLAAAQVAISYVVAGHIEDANAFLRKAAAKNPQAGSEDVRRLLSMMVSASKGVYPPPQEFFAFSSDAVRLQAYMELAIFYDRIGQSDYSRRMAADMARFAEKRSFRGDSGSSNTVFGKLLIETF